MNEPTELYGKPVVFLKTEERRGRPRVPSDLLRWRMSVKTHLASPAHFLRYKCDRESIWRSTQEMGMRIITNMHAK